MKKGVNVWCFPEDYTIERCVKIAKEQGFDGIEINMEEEGRAGDTRLSLADPKGSAAAIKAIADRVGIAVSSVSTGLGWKYPLASKDAALRDKAKEVIRAMIDAAVVFGADTVLVVPARVDADHSYEYCYNAAIQGLKELAGYAAEHKVYIGVENVWNKFLLSPLDFRRFIEEVGAPYVQVYFDVGNVLLFSYPENWIDVLGPMIKKVHVKDFHWETRNFSPLLAGDVNWPLVIQKLRAAGYDSYLTAEVAVFQYYPDVSIHHTSAALDAMLKG